MCKLGRHAKCAELWVPRNKFENHCSRLLPVSRPQAPSYLSLADSYICVMWKPLPGLFHSPVNSTPTPGWAMCMCAHVCVSEWWTHFCSLSLSVYVQRCDFGNCALSLHTATRPFHFQRKNLPKDNITDAGWKLLFSSHFIYWTRRR